MCSSDLVFLGCSDATLGLAGPAGTGLLRGIGLLALMFWLRREWPRRLHHHSRERVLHGLRPLLLRHQAGPAPHAGLPSVLDWLRLQEPPLQHQIGAPLLRGLLNDLRRQPHLDGHVVVTLLMTLHRALGQPVPDPRELLLRLGRPTDG